jgi:hypothetical protein
MFSNANASNIMRRLIFIFLHCNKNRIPFLFVKEMKIFVKKYCQKS